MRGKLQPRWRGKGTAGLARVWGTAVAALITVFTPGPSPRPAPATVLTYVGGKRICTWNLPPVAGLLRATAGIPRVHASYQLVLSALQGHCVILTIRLL